MSQRDLSFHQAAKRVKRERKSRISGLGWGDQDFLRLFASSASVFSRLCMQNEVLNPISIMKKLLLLIALIPTLAVAGGKSYKLISQFT
jgi:hypothetical protein